MPSIARITATIVLLLLPGILPAWATDQPASQSPAEQYESMPPLLEPSAGPVRIAPPLAAAEKVAHISAQGERPASSTQPSGRESLVPLSPPDRNASRDADKKTNGKPSMAVLAGGLGVVLGIFFIFAWLMRKAAPQGFSRLPNEAFEVLGRAPLAGRQNVHLLRCGNKLLLVSITPTGTETLTEITDPPEVDRLAGLCRQAGPHSSTAVFRRIFEQLAPKRPARDNFSRGEYEEYDRSEIEPRDSVDWELRNV
jgi:flagellar biogenesis protein FliO